MILLAANAIVSVKVSATFFFNSILSLIFCFIVSSILIIINQKAPDKSQGFLEEEVFRLLPSNLWYELFIPYDIITI